MPTRCRQISEQHMIALWTTLHPFIPGRESLQNSRRKSSLMATSLIIPASCRWTIGTRFMKRSRRSASSVLPYLRVRDLRMRRAGGTARASRLLCVLLGLVYLGLQGFFGENADRVSLLRVKRAPRPCSSDELRWMRFLHSFCLGNRQTRFSYPTEIVHGEPATGKFKLFQDLQFSWGLPVGRI
jgi:hypothetical protein